MITNTHFVTILLLKIQPGYLEDSFHHLRSFILCALCEKVQKGIQWMLIRHMQTNCLEYNSKANNNTNSKLCEDLDPAPTDTEFCV